MARHGKSRSRTAHQPKMIATSVAWLLIAIVSISAGLLVASRPWIWVPAFGESVSAEAQPPSLALCQSSRAYYVGLPDPLPNTENCDPFKIQLGIPQLIKWGGLQHSSAKPPMDTRSATSLVRPAAANAHKGKTHRVAPHQSPASIAGRIVTSATNQVDASLSTATAGIHVWLLLLIGTIFTLTTMACAFVLVFGLNHLRHKRIGRTYSLKSNAGFLSAMLAVCLALICWSWASSNSWANAKTVEDAVGSISKLVPAPAGRINLVDQGVVLGDSTVAHEGGLLAHWPCYRGKDSLANLLDGHIQDPGETPGAMSDTYRTIQWKNLACAGATIEQGLLGPQTHGSKPGEVFTEPAQVGVLEHVIHRQFVVVEIGENDVGLTYDAKMCIVKGACFNMMSAHDFQLRLEQFDNDFQLLIEELKPLVQPKDVVFNLPYDIMEPSAAGQMPVCTQARFLTAQDIELLDKRNQELRAKEYYYAHQAGMRTVQPQMIPLCEPYPVGQPDIIGLWSPDGKPNPEALHPTIFGEEQIASADEAAINSILATQSGATSSGATGSQR